MEAVYVQHAHLITIKKLRSEKVEIKRAITVGQSIWILDFRFLSTFPACCFPSTTKDFKIAIVVHVL